MIVSLCCASLFSMAFTASVKDDPAYDATLEHSCEGFLPLVATDEGLEMLQARANKVSAHVYTKTDTGEDMNAKEQALDVSYMEQKLDPEISLLEDSDPHMLRFRAKGLDWADILNVYDDGFFQRYHSQDSGVWTVKNNQLVLKWIQGKQDSMQSTDNGRNFFKRDDEAAFTLNRYCYFQPRWWRNAFKNQTGGNATSATPIDEGAIVAKHIDGTNANLDEKGYQAVAFLKNNSQMVNFIHRVANSLTMRIKDEGSLAGMVPYYSGARAKQNLGRMMEELKRIAGEPLLARRWVTYKYDTH